MVRKRCSSERLSAAVKPVEKMYVNSYNVTAQGSLLVEVGESLVIEGRSRFRMTPGPCQTSLDFASAQSHVAHVV
jgi:hypothetical protein